MSLRASTALVAGPQEAPCTMHARRHQAATQARGARRDPIKYSNFVIQQILQQKRDVWAHTSPTPCPAPSVCAYSAYSVYIHTAMYSRYDTLYIRIRYTVTHPPSGFF